MDDHRPDDYTVAASSHVSAYADKPYEPIGFKGISADSHITEPPNCYIDYIDPSFRDVAPRVITGPTGGDFYQIDGIEKPVPLEAIASAGVDPSQMKFDQAKFAD